MVERCPRFTSQQLSSIGHQAEKSANDDIEAIVSIKGGYQVPELGSWKRGETARVIRSAASKVMREGYGVIHTHPPVPEDLKPFIDDPLLPSFGDLYTHAKNGKEMMCIASSDTMTMRCHRADVEQWKDSDNVVKQWKDYLSGKTTPPNVDVLEKAVTQQLTKLYTTEKPCEYSLPRSR